MSRRIISKSVPVLLAVFACSCSPFSSQPVPGPDKGGEGLLFGAASGAGAGAITGAQVSAATGPGAWIGAGLGGIIGLLSGFGFDAVEEDQIKQSEQTQCARDFSWAQQRLAEHYQKRLALHPSRDIFPADWFFKPDSAEFRPGGEALVQLLAQLTQRRMPWSRILIAAYNTSADPESGYAKHVTAKRAEAIAVSFIGSGFEPRRVLAQGSVLNEPLLIDPNDHPGRYRQAVEIVALDY